MDRRQPIYAEARDLLDRSRNAETLEAVWAHAAAAAVLTGDTTDPPVTLLKELTTPERAWDNQPWPPEYVWERGRSMSDCHFLAIAVSDCEWLEQLLTSWEVAPVAPEWRLLSSGQIGLGIRRHGHKAFLWDQDDVEWLIHEDSLSLNTPNGRGWIAVASSDFRTARMAIDEYRSELDRWTKEWNEAAGTEIRRVLGYPGKILRVELRALQMLVSGESSESRAEAK